MLGKTILQERVHVLLSRSCNVKTRFRDKNHAVRFSVTPAAPTVWACYLLFKALPSKKSIAQLAADFFSRPDLRWLKSSRMYGQELKIVVSTCRKKNKFNVVRACVLQYHLRFIISLFTYHLKNLFQFNFPS